MAGSGESLRFGIIGTGSRGTWCFGKLLAERQDAYIAALADPNPARMAKAQEILGIKANCYTDIEEMLRNEALDSVVITSPDYTHEENALLAIRHGVRALVDKPLATSAAGCRKIIEEAERRGVQVSVGFNLRYRPLLKKIKELIDEGRIGAPMLMENREFYDGGRTYMSRWNRRQEFSGGLWIHKGSHDFDVFNWWNEQGNPTRVAAFAGVNALRADRIPFKVEPGRPVGPRCRECTYREACPDYMEVELDGPRLYDDEEAVMDGYTPDLCMYTSDKDTHDNGVAIVEYDNGVRASHIECFVCGFTDRIYTVVGDRGIITASLSSGESLMLHPRWGGGKSERIEASASEGGHGGADPLMVEAYIAGIRSGKVLLAGARDGLKSVAVGEAAEKSWREHCMVEMERA